MVLVKQVSVRVSADGIADADLKISRITAKAVELGRLDPAIKPQVDSAAALLQARLLKEGITAELSKATVEVGAGPTPGLDALKLKLADLSARVTNTKVDVNDTAATAKILALKARLASLDEKVTPEISLSGFAKAEAEIAAVDASLSRLSEKSGGGRFSGIASAFSSSNLFGLKGGMSLPGFLGGAGGLGPVGIAGIGVALAGVAAAAASVLPPLVAAGMGVSAFGALAIPTFTKVTGAVAKIAADTAKLNAATTAASRSSALAKIKADWAALSPEQAKLVKDVQAFQGAWSAAAAKIGPVVLRIMNEGLKIANKLLPDMVPFAEAAGKAIGGLLRQFDRFASSPGFKLFLAQMLKMTGPAITTIGQGIGKVAVALGRFLQQVASPQGMAILSGMFSAVAGAIRGIGAALHGIGAATNAVGRWFIAVAEVGLNAAHGIAIAFLDATSTIVHAAADAFGWIPGIGADLRHSADNFDSWRRSLDATFAHARSTLDGWAGALRNAPKIARLQGDITDLQSKLATARSALRDPNLTATRRARVEADISQLSIALAQARSQLMAMQGLSVTTFIRTVATGIPGHAIQHAGGGFTPTAGLGMGWSRIIAGDQGPEAIDVPPGSYVHTATRTRQMQAAQRGGNSYTINLYQLVADRNTGAKVVEAIKIFEKGSGSGWRS